MFCQLADNPPRISETHFRYFGTGELELRGVGWDEENFFHELFWARTYWCPSCLAILKRINK
jgi:hypothetical protein